ncbi:hypothetical protein SDC9_182693 [bioreactor metagenome]|uniref:Uncharacterized protein n=1 Tax=bioreactor metagenome TaxID=1076179 RepID=A0A645H9K2_9ZZZZ
MRPYNSDTLMDPETGKTIDPETGEDASGNNEKSFDETIGSKNYE